MRAAEARAAERFGSGELTLPLRWRVLLSVLIVGFLAAHVLLIGRIAVSPDPRPAALVFLMLGIFGPLGGFSLWTLWRSRGEWRLTRTAEEGERKRMQDELAQALRGPAVNPALRPSGGDGSGPALAEPMDRS